jgi:hypothetical protein
MHAKKALLKKGVFTALLVRVPLERGHKLLEHITV